MSPMLFIVDGEPSYLHKLIYGFAMSEKIGIVFKLSGQTQKCYTWLEPPEIHKGKR
tara:strand:- start:25987 stop:26154 length:168 start_codon:yes stop_codon:yes gene_type:complete